MKEHVQVLTSYAKTNQFNGIIVNYGIISNVLIFTK